MELGRTPTLEEARILYVKGVERLLKRVNQDPQIRPYLHNYPFTVSNLTYTMQFPYVAVDASGTGPIVDIMCVRGRVYYDVLEPNNGRGDLRAMHIEPYADALRIVRESGALDDLTQR